MPSGYAAAADLWAPVIDVRGGPSSSGSWVALSGATCARRNESVAPAAGSSGPYACCWDPFPRSPALEGFDTIAQGVVSIDIPTNGSGGLIGIAVTDDSEWTLVFRQTASYSWPAGLLAKNKGDVTADNYAILDELEGLRDCDGKLAFKLVYPKRSAGPNSNTWKQTNNPTMKAQDAYEAISVAINATSLCGNFAGLWYNGSFSSALVQGCAGKRWFGIGHADGTISADGVNESVVELYARSCASRLGGKYDVAWSDGSASTRMDIAGEGATSSGAGATVTVHGASGSVRHGDLVDSADASCPPGDGGDCFASTMPSPGPLFMRRSASGEGGSLDVKYGSLSGTATRAEDPLPSYESVVKDSLPLSYWRLDHAVGGRLANLVPSGVDLKQVDAWPLDVAETAVEDGILPKDGYSEFRLKLACLGSSMPAGGSYGCNNAVNGVPVGSWTPPVVPWLPSRRGETSEAWGSWVAAGPGVGAWIELGVAGYTDQPAGTNAFSQAADGVCKIALLDRAAPQARARGVRLVLQPGGQTYDFELSGSSRAQLFDFGPVNGVTSARLTITSVWSGGSDRLEHFNGFQLIELFARTDLPLVRFGGADGFADVMKGSAGAGTMTNARLSEVPPALAGVKGSEALRVLSIESVPSGADAGVVFTGSFPAGIASKPITMMAWVRMSRSWGGARTRNLIIIDLCDGAPHEIWHVSNRHPKSLPQACVCASTHPPVTVTHAPPSAARAGVNAPNWGGQPGCLSDRFLIVRARRESGGLALVPWHLLTVLTWVGG